MRTLERNGAISARIRSYTAPLRDLARGVDLPVKIIHDRGEHYTRRNGTVSQKPSKQNYVCFDIGPVQTPAEVDAGIARALVALRGTGLAAAIASGEAEAELDVAAFQGDIDWERELSPDLIAKAKAAHLQVWIEHYDRFTDEGAPLSVRL